MYISQFDYNFVLTSTFQIEYMKSTRFQKMHRYLSLFDHFCFLLTSHPIQSNKMHFPRISPIVVIMMRRGLYYVPPSIVCKKYLVFQQMSSNKSFIKMCMKGNGLISRLAFYQPRKKVSQKLQNDLFMISRSTGRCIFDTEFCVSICSTSDYFWATKILFLACLCYLQHRSIVLFVQYRKLD